MNSPLYLIIRREYLERVSRKSFIITTILTPILMLGLMMLPTLAMVMAGPENKTIAVIDYSDKVAPTLQGDDEIKFVIIDDPKVTVDSVKHMTDYDAILIIGRDIADNTDNVQLYTQSAPSMQTEQFISQQIAHAVQNERIRRYDIPDLKQIMSDLDVKISMSTFRLDTDRETSSMVSYLIGIVVSMMLYMFLLIYGQMVMNSIIEEKTNRVLEVVVSSVKPKTLMMGKIVGVGLVAVTQILIWGVLVASFSKWAMPLITSAVGSGDTDLLAAMNQLGDASYVMMIFGYIVLFLIGGYLFYSSIFAAIGSAVDNVQDASQLTSLALVPIMLGMVFSMVVVADPNSALAFWLSEIPFTSPMVMMARIPFGISAWEIALSLVLLYASVYLIILLAAKIYRIGIFMYGKKPTLKEIWKWTFIK